MSKANAYELDWLVHFFQNAAIAGVGDGTGLPAASTAGSLYISLHSADPGETGTQVTSELAYSGYARVAVARNNTAWVITTASGSVSPASNIEFATSAGSGATAHFFGVGYTSTGTGVLAYSGTVSPAIARIASVTAVYPDSPAEEADLQEGDVILGPPEARLEVPRQIREWTMLATVDKPASLAVLRGDERLDVTIVPKP